MPDAKLLLWSRKRWEVDARDERERARHGPDEIRPGIRATITPAVAVATMPQIGQGQARRAAIKPLPGSFDADQSRGSPA